MKTINWQTKTLALFIAAIALCLTGACGNADPDNETQTTKEVITTPSDVAPMTPTVAAPTPQVGCTHETPGLRSVLNTAEGEYWVGRPGAWRARDVRDKYEDLFWRQPNVYDVTVNQLLDDKGGWTKHWGITVWVTEKVDQNSLPPEDRIPDHLQNVPIQIIDAEQPPKVPESSCDYSMCVVNLEKGEEGMAKQDPNTRIDPAELARRQGPSEYRVRNKYEPLFWRQPNVYATGLGLFTDENDEITGASGIIVMVSKKVDQSTLPPEDRIPDCLEGIPVQIEEIDPPIRISGSTQKGDN